MRLTLLPAGGLHLWFALPAGADDTAIAQHAEAGGVTVSPGRRWFAAEPPGPHLRLTFAGADPVRLAEGVRRLAAAAPELAG
jgi:DNA-binding transcriptional MocR family regulator